MTIAFNELEQFLTHTDKHRENVSKIAEYLFDSMIENDYFKEKYEISSKTNTFELKNKFKEVIKVHDKAKMIDSPVFLKKHNLDMPFYEFLFKKVGTVITGEDRKVLDKMNEVDGLITTITMHKQGLSIKERDMFNFVEHVADIVERGCNPLTKYELGREVSKASEFKRGHCNMHELKMIMKMEEFYENSLMPQQKVFARKLFSQKKENNFIKDLIPKMKTNSLAFGR